MLIKLYAETTSLQLERPMSADDLRQPMAEEHGPSEIGVSPIEQTTDSYRASLDYRLPKLIVDVAEAMIRRHHPDAPEAVSACLTDNSPGLAVRLNQIAGPIKMPDGRAMLAVWLASFDRPDMPDYVGIGDEIADRGQRAILDFVDTCAALVRDIMAAGGTNTTTFTVGVTSGSLNQAAGD